MITMRQPPMEDDYLVLEPHCACGNPLNDDYFCNKCNKQCRCRYIACDDEITLEPAKKYVMQSPKFSAFTVMLAD